MKRRFLAGLLAIALSISMSATTFAAELPQTQVESEVAEKGQEEQEKDAAEPKKEETGEKENDSEKDSEKAIETEVTEKDKEAAEKGAKDTAKADVEKAKPKAASAKAVTDAWTVADFTYTEMEQTLNGCDYTRQIVIKGSAVAGFSESGKEKVKTNKNLVLPSVNDKGEKLVGVAENAFREQGLESVKFPTGMMVDYDDTVTHVVTRRGNYIVGTGAFSKNNLTDVYLPEGVIAIMPSAFKNNKIENVSIPHTVWWVENSCFDSNNLTTVGFPKTCDFQMQIHAFAFSHNNIKSVRLPDYCEVVEKKVFYWNPGMEDCPTDAPEKEQGFGGVVYMYTDNPNLANMERIHHIERTAESQKSWHQKLIVGSRPEEEGAWTSADFTFEGTKITGLSASGVEKRADKKDLVLPDKTPSGEWVTEIGDTTNANGLFATKEEKFESVTFPSHIEKIGNKAFADSGLKRIGNFPNTLKEIGLAAFQMNHLTAVILPDSVTTLGGGAFGSNAEIETIVLSKNLKEIPSGAFGCSTADLYMTNLTELTIPEGVTKIGQNAFAGNNIKNIVIPSTVTEIGRFAFSTKNYLKDECTLTLPEGLKTIGSRAFRNKVIKEVQLPTTVESLDKNTFEKEYSDDTVATKTKVYVSKTQFADKKNFPDSDYHEYMITIDENDTQWDAFDFTYEQWGDSNVDEVEVTFYPAHEMDKEVVLNPYYITGLSDIGKAKLEKNKHLVIPATDPYGKKVTGIGVRAFYKMGIESVTFPEGVMTKYDGPDGVIKDGVTERGDFVIMSNAFFGNNLKTLTLPEGVIGVGTYAFKGNKQLTKVVVPHTLWRISNGGFADGAIQSVEFPEDCDFKLNIDRQAFAINKIKAVQLPKRTEKLDKWAFMQNTGMEPVTSGTTAEKKGGIVYMYADPSVEKESFVDHLDCVGSHKSNVQKLITDEEMPEELKPWNVNDFTFDGTTITGLSESGAKKRANDPNMVMPNETPDGKAVTAIADTERDGLFTTDDEKLNSVVLPNKLEKIGEKAFYDSDITEVTFPETLKTIGKQAFQMTNLVDVILPDSVTEIGSSAFASVFTVENVKLPANITEIPDGMFSCAGQIAAEKFTKIELPKGITRIGTAAFAGNNFSRIEIPEGVKSIGNSAFAQTQATRSLKEIILPEGLETIGRWAFRYTLATEVKLPTTMVEKNGRNAGLHKDAFRDNGGKVTLYTSNKNHLDWYKDSNYHTVVYNNLIGTGWELSDFVFDGTKLVGWSEEGNKTRLENKKLVLPETNPETGEAITEIGDRAFKIPDDEVTQLKDSVDSPNGMETVKIPETVTKIGEKAFEYNNFKTLDFPDGLKTIAFHAFHGNKLEAVDIPENATDLGGGAFSENNITSIKLPSKLEKIPQGIFSMNIRLEHVDIPKTVTEIGDTAFAGARLTSLDIPKSVTKIGRKAFHLHHLTELTIPGNVKEIGDSAFEGTFKAITLKKLVLEEGVEKIGEKAFKEGYIESVVLPESLKELAPDAFIGNAGTNNDHVVVLNTSNPDHMELPAVSTDGSMTSADGNVYQKLVFNAKWSVDCFTYDGTTITGLSEKGLKNLKYTTEIVLPDKNPDGKYITAIGKDAFKDLGITKVTLPKKLEKIEEGAFTGNSITEVTLPDSIKEVADNAFDEETKVNNMPSENPGTGDGGNSGTGDGGNSGSGNSGNSGTGNDGKPGTGTGNKKPAAGGKGNSSGAAKTADEAPLIPFAMTVVIACAVIMYVKNKKRSIR